MNGRQFIYHMQGLTKTYPPPRRCWITSTCRSTRTPRSACSASTAPASPRCCASWPASTPSSPARAGSPRAPASATWSRSRSSTRKRPCARTSWRASPPRRRSSTATTRSPPTIRTRPPTRWPSCRTRSTSKNLWDLDSQVDLAMDALRCPADDADMAKLSGGERRRVALCRLLLDQPDLLLLDEPTNHLDAESVNWLEGHLRNYPGAILIVTHDRYFLDNVTGWILELDHGRGIPYEGNYTSWLHQKQKRMEQEGREDESRRRTLERESEWISSSPKARQAKSKARYERYEELLKIANAKQNTVAQITIPVAERLGQNVVDFDHLKKGYGDNLLIDDLTFNLAARRHCRRDRTERRRQDHAVPHDHRPGQAGRRHHQDRRVGAARLCRPVARYARRQKERVGGNFQRPGHHPGRQEGSELARLRLVVQFQGRRPAEEGRHAVGRRAQPRASRQDAAHRRQSAAARRTDQRSRRRYAARAGRGAGGFRRLRRDHQP